MDERIENVKKLIRKHIQGQGTSVDASGELPNILNTLLDIASEGNALMIHATEDEQVNSYDVPKLTAEDVTRAYNAIVSGRGCLILDKDEICHYAIVQADSINNVLNINILYHNIMLLSYTLEGEDVTIRYKEIDGNEG